ncbi:Uncharacterized protein TCM_031755 [Theobroma cacao]|uniref:TF-B3 domain-containing protein n=1 Tax=Theobroma cacao TaxID=3641 RepID=A0A061F8N4_THECC|nr:Uncharacterized protein TCM_031755 [Theobroma cacao]
MQMAIPTDFMEHLPHYEGGWTTFYPVHDHKHVRAKSLKPGDKIIFRVEENAANSAPRYTIAAQRKIVLLGNAAWTGKI